MNINLEENINILYDIIYNKINTCYDIEKIDINNIKKTDIKISDTDFSINHLLNNVSFQFLFEIDNNLYYKRISNELSIMVKIAFDNDNDCLLSYILSYLVLKNKTTHILLPILNIESDTEKVKDILGDKYVEKKKCLIQIRESFFQTDILKNYINTKNIKIILFQIIHTLLVIKKYYPKFNHNNFNLDNIFVYINNNFQKKINTYIFNEKTYKIPNTEFEIKISNFEDSNLIGTQNNNDFKTLAKSIFETIDNINSETKKFLNLLLTNKNLENILDDKYFKFSEKKETSKKISKKISKKTSKKQSRKLQSAEENILVGGYYTAPYKKEINTPFQTNDEKNTETKKKNETSQPDKKPYEKNQDDKKPYEKNQDDKKPYEKKPYEKKQETSNDDAKLPPAYIPVVGNDGLVMSYPYPYPYATAPNPIYNEPIQKTYNISLVNPIGDHTTINRVFEDMIPGDPKNLSFTTTFERVQLIDFIRNIILDSNDGEEMNITGGKNSLLSFIKMLEINPYSLNMNPYKDLPNNFILYRGAYPIRFDTEKRNLHIAKSSMGVNIRIYNMSYGEFNAHIINDKINMEKFDLWRELEYYRYVKENIINKKISPNFISLILYKIDTKSNIDWSKLNSIKNKNILKNVQEIIINNTKLINKSHDLENFKNSRFVNLKNAIETIVYVFYNKTHSYLLDKIKQPNPNSTIKFCDFDDIRYINIINKLKVTKVPCIFIKKNNKIEKYTGDINDINNVLNIEKLDITVSTGNSLVLLTEAPHISFIKWASPAYENFGTVKKMVATGYHSEDVWRSIIFQLVYIFAVLQEKKIYIDELNLQNSFYIKDLPVDNTNLTYWIFNINNLNYYIPNYGHLVVLDSKYSDIIKPNNNNSIYYKICLDKFSDNGIFNGNFDSEIKIQFKNTIDRVNFGKNLKILGGLPPTESILTLIDNISTDTTDKILFYFENYFKNYLHNKIGTLLNKSDVENLSLLNRPNLNNIGKLLVHQRRYDEYVWVMIANQPSPPIGPNQIRVYTKDTNNNIIIEDVFKFSLFGYPDIDKIIPDPTININYDNKNLLEVYKLSY